METPTPAPAPVYDPLQDYVNAAHGDPSACLRLSLMARAAVLDGSDDALTASMEGATLARLAAIRGSMEAACLMALHLFTVAELYEIAGDSSHAASSCAEGLALLELSEGHTPQGWSAPQWSEHIHNLVTTTAANTDAQFMAAASHYRGIWAPFLSICITPTAGDAQ